MVKDWKEFYVLFGFNDDETRRTVQVLAQLEETRPGFSYRLDLHHDSLEPALSTPIDLWRGGRNIRNYLRMAYGVEHIDNKPTEERQAA